MSIIAIMNSKGGAGKTATALNLIYHLKKNATVRVADLDVHSGISNINTLNREDPLEILTPKTKAQLLMILKSDNDEDFTVFDCGGYDDELTSLAIANANLIIIAANEDPIEQFAIRDCNTRLHELSHQINKHLVGYVLLNRVHHLQRKFDGFDSLIENFNHIERLSVTIPFSKKIPKAQETGQALKNGAIAARYAALATKIKGLR